MTSRQEKDFSHLAVRAAESQSTPAAERYARSIRLHTLPRLLLVSDIIMVQIHPFGPNDSGLQAASLPPQRLKMEGGWLDEQRSVKLPRSQRAGIH